MEVVTAGILVLMRSLPPRAFPAEGFFLFVPPLLASHTPIPRDPISFSDSISSGNGCRAV